ncbi:DUF6228 family protein [Promicromonospora sp. Populi]|uniref:DUF6228 family protein n=1 Tax=Promicromonospora sp. Populi TaxID=3239420 RepID=UPI0034E21379
MAFEWLSGNAVTYPIVTLGGDLERCIGKDALVHEVRIGSASEHLLLKAGADPEAPQSLAATLQSNGLAAATQVPQHYATGFQDLAEFFATLEEGWRGWAGVQTWKSLEGELTIEARHQFGHVRLTVTLRNLRWEWGNDGWHATVDLTIDPGEQLSRIARETAALASGEE